MNNERRIARAHSFDTVAELYDRARHCPEELIDDLFTLAMMTPRDTSVLELGMRHGTSQRSAGVAPMPYRMRRDGAEPRAYCAT
jgi:hypothetical protein